MSKPYTYLGNANPNLVNTTHDDYIVGILLVIRDELRTLNRLLHCANFTGIPHTLTRIEKNTKKRRKKKATVTSIRRAA